MLVLSKQIVILFTVFLFVADSQALISTPRGCSDRNTNRNANVVEEMAGEKRKYVSDGKDLLESFAALEGDRLHTHTLILGTLPSDKSYGQNLSNKEILLRGGDGHQNYGHSRNSFWHIIGSAFGFQRHRTPFKDQVRILTDEGYSVWDVLSTGKRKGSLDANLVKGSLTPTDLPRFILDHPNLNRFVFAANSAEVFCKQEVWGHWLATGEAKTNETVASIGNGENVHKQPCEVTVKTKFWMQGSKLNNETFARTNAIFGKKKAVEIVDDLAVSRAYRHGCDKSGDTNRRVIELIVMPSTSPANAMMRPPEKEKKWHIACYRFREPPQHYVCPGCEHHFRTATSSNSEYKSEKHWFQDCPYREDWKKFMKAQSKTKSKEDRKGVKVDPFYWYT